VVDVDDMTEAPETKYRFVPDPGESGPERPVGGRHLPVRSRRCWMGPQSERFSNRWNAIRSSSTYACPRSMRSSIDDLAMVFVKAATVRWFPWQNWAAGRPARSTR